MTQYDSDLSTRKIWLKSVNTLNFLYICFPGSEKSSTLLCVKSFKPVSSLPQIIQVECQFVGVFKAQIYAWYTWKSRKQNDVKEILLIRDIILSATIM